MTTGMKKFTKGCLMTALVIFIIGAALCGVGGVLGGFRQLNGMDVRGITGFPFVYRIGSDGFEYGFLSGDGGDIDWSGYENWQGIDVINKEKALALTADTLHDLYIEAGGCKLYIEESEDEYVRLAVSGHENRFRYLVEDDSLRLVRKSGWKWNWVQINRDTWGTFDKVYLYLPKGTELDYADIELGAGYIESVGIKARDVDIEVGAGECIIENLTVTRDAVLSVGAGRIKVKGLECDTADLDIGAGELEIDDMVIAKDTDIVLGMGNVDISGVIRGNLDIDCNMGNVNLDMNDDERNHNYNIECSMGNVKVGSRSYTGMAGEQSIDNGSSSYYDINCSMGNVTIKFAR